MCWFKKNKKSEEPITKGHKAPPEPFVPEIKKLQIMWQITVINNITDKEILHTSTNEFGLKFSAEKESIAIRQNRDINQDSWMLVGHFLNWSISKIGWKEVQVRTLEKGGYELINE